MILFSTNAYKINFQWIEHSKCSYDEARIYQNERYTINHFMQMGISNIASLYNLVIQFQSKNHLHKSVLSDMNFHLKLS